MESTDRKKLLHVYDLFKSLEKIYNRLAELEIDNKIQTEEYVNLFKLVRYINKRANDELKDVLLCDEDVFDFFKFLQRKEHLESDDIFTITDLDTNNPLRRLISYTNSLSISRHEEISIPLHYVDQNGNPVDVDNMLSDDMVDTIIEQYAEQGIEVTEDMLYTKEQMDEDYKKEILIQDEILMFRDLLFTHTYMDYLQDQINEEKDPEFRAELIRQKYKAIYVCKGLEDEFMKNPIHFTQTRLLQRLVDTHRIGNEELYNDAYLEMLKVVVESDLAGMAEIPEGDYASLQDKAKLTCAILYDKALLSANYSRELDSELYYFSKMCKDEALNKDVKERLEKVYELKKDYSIQKILTKQS